MLNPNIPEYATSMLMRHADGSFSVDAAELQGGNINRLLFSSLYDDALDRGCAFRSCLLYTSDAADE